MSIDNNNIKTLATLSLGDSDMTEYVSQYTDVSITDLSLEFWEWVWLGVILGGTL